MVEWQEVSNGYVLRGARYGARLVMGEFPFFQFALDGVTFGEFPAASCFDRCGEKEQISAVELVGIRPWESGFAVEFQGKSTLWEAHRFVWRFEKKRAEYFHVIQGQGDLGRCYFFSTGIPGAYDHGSSQGWETNARVNVEYYFNPAVNLGNVEEFRNAQQGNTGLGTEFPVGEQMLLERAQGLFSPSPLCFCFYDGPSAMGIGLGTQPGNYRFNAFEYSPLSAPWVLKKVEISWLEAKRIAWEVASSIN